MDFSIRYHNIRSHTLHLCRDLQPEDTVLQPAEFVSPVKWHLAHTTWFFETFLLKEFLPGYALFDPRFPFLFNSYYETLGERIGRDNRGVISRPYLHEVMAYRQHVDAAMERLLNGNFPESAMPMIELGLQHEQQHQELLVTDLLYSLHCNPSLPAWDPFGSPFPDPGNAGWLSVDAGIYNIGYEGSGFCFDNELGVHKQYIETFEICSRPVINAEYLEFIAAGGYSDFRNWLSEGWDWVQKTNAEKPLYWQQENGNWKTYGPGGMQPLRQELPVMHINYYEADAFARWKKMRLPTEYEHETAAKKYPQHFRPYVWEWTQSAYLPYPGFAIAEGAAGEYNGKFMVSQMVLRGASVATPEGHARPTYRNFFHPSLQWQFSGLRLVKAKY